MKQALLAGRATLARWDGTARVDLEDFVTGSRLTATGTVATRLRHWLERGGPAPTADLVPHNSPLGELLGGMASERPVPLTPSACLEQNGFHTLFVELTGRCNEHCAHCYASSSPREKRALPREVIEEVLRDASRLGFQQVQLTGGEPLLVPHLVDLVALARRLAISSVEIFTNGTLLRPALLERLAPHGPSFAVSIYADDSAVHDAITRKRGSHRRTVAAIERVLAAGLRLRASIIVMKENAARLQATRTFLQTLGVERIGVSRSHEVGRGTYFSDGALGESAASHRDEHSDVARRQGRLCVAYSGEVYPCIFNRQDRLGNIFERSLTQIVAAPELPEAVASDTAATRLACAGCRMTHTALRRLASDRSAVDLSQAAGPMP